MTVHKIYPVGFAANSYLVTNDGRRAIAIDPAQPRVFEEAQKRGLTVEAVLLTHGHFDHIEGVGAFFAQGAKVACMREELPLVFGEDNLASTMGCGMLIPPFRVELPLFDGQELTLCGLQIKVIATPGHTAGGCCYLIEDTLFTGDTLFEGNYGRCDLPTGSYLALERSLQKLFALGKNYKVCAGHGEDTTLDQEKGYYGL